MVLDARPASASAPALGGGRGVEVVVAPGPPALAPGTELLGTLSGSGYREAPGLVRRGDGQTLQVTPLLYALLSCVQEGDGTRDADGLADALSERTGRLVTAADVEQLLESRLRPQGLLADAAGTVPAVRRASPLLALRLKVVVTDPTVTGRITAPFAALFHPWVVLPVLAAFAATVWWALVERGLAGAAHQAFHEPGLLLLVFALTVASAGFHELGHAAACRYGGATPGAMGAGLYLVWPAFWTDVDDSYRLSRWGRLRVDLGGLYFNAVVTVAVAVSALVTGTDALLLVVATQLLQMARQLAPFVRADGYHLLADLTGVPDLFAHVRPTLLGLLPTRWGRPEGRVLRPWARVVVTAWVLVTVPVLVGLLVLLVVLLPRLVATAWSGLGAQSGRLAADLADGDVLLAAARLLGLLGLVFPAVAVSYLLARVVRRTALWVWRRTEDRPTGRLVTVCAAAFLGAVLAGAWWPSGQYRPVAAAPPAPVSTPVVAPAVAAAEPVAAPAPSPAARRAPATAAGEPRPSPPRHSPPRPAAPEVAVAAAPQPVVAAAAPRDRGWVFPFARPGSPGPHDVQALAVASRDGADVVDVRTGLHWVTDGSPVLHRNEAWALASCTDCRATAAALQVVVVVGQADVQVPLDLAVATSYDCLRCTTRAVAVQLVAGVTGLPDARTTAQLRSVVERVRGLQGRARTMTTGELDAVLRGARDEALGLLRDAGVLAGTRTASSSDGDEGAAGPVALTAGEEVLATPSPRASADPTGTPAPDATGAPGTTTTGTAGTAEPARTSQPTEDPGPTGTPSPSPSPEHAREPDPTPEPVPAPTPDPDPSPSP